MAEKTLVNCKFFIDSFDLSGDMNALALNYQAEINDATRFGSTSRTFLGGVRMGDFSHEGLWDANDTDQPDDVIFSRIGTKVTMTVAPIAGLTGETAYINQGIFGSYNPGAGHGENLEFSVSGEFSEEFIQGTVLQNATEAASGNSVARNLGAVASTQLLYAALHVVTVSGTSPTLDVLIQSDDNSGMTSPITRGTFTQKTAISSEWLTPVIATTSDVWWRANFTIGGASPSFTFIVTMGIK